MPKVAVIKPNQNRKFNITAPIEKLVKGLQAFYSVNSRNTAAS